VPLAAGEGGWAGACRRRRPYTAGAGTPGGSGHPHPAGSYVPVCSQHLTLTHPGPANSLTYRPRHSYHSRECMRKARSPYPTSRCAAPRSTPDPSLRKSARGVQETYPVRVSRPGQPVPPAYSGNLRGRDSIIHNLRLLGTTRVMVSDTPASPGDTHTNELTRS